MVVGAPIGTGIGVAPIVVRTAQELKEALGQREKPIIVEDATLARNAELIYRLGKVLIIGSLLAYVTSSILLGGIERGYKIEVNWSLVKQEGRLILTPPPQPKSK